MPIEDVKVLIRDHCRRARVTGMPEDTVVAVFDIAQTSGASDYNDSPDDEIKAVVSLYNYNGIPEYMGY